MSVRRIVPSLVLLAAAAVAQAGPIRLELSAPHLSTGSQWHVSLGMAKAQADQVALTGPFTARFTLPPAVSLVSHVGSNWSCAAPLAGALACTWNGTLTPANGQASHLSLTLQVPPSITPGPWNQQVTVETAQVPLPAPLVCAASPSDTGCAVVATQIVQSTLIVNDWGWGHDFIDQPGPVAVRTQPWEAGTQPIVVLQVRNTGYGTSNTPVRALLHLPPGITYSGLMSGIPSWSCSGAPDGGGQLLTCTTPAMFDGQNGFISMRLAIAPDIAVPGPVQIHARLHNNVQQPTLATCIAQPASTGCGRLTSPTRPPRVPNLVISSVSHAPDTLSIGASASLAIHFANIGEGQAAATRILASLPPGIAYSHATGAIPALACSAAGAVATGQLVTCTGAGLPATLTGQVNLQLNVMPGTTTPAVLPVVVAADQAATPTPGLMEACIADPQLPYCAWRGLPVAWRCADQHGADGVFCNGYEPLPTGAP